MGDFDDVTLAGGAWAELPGAIRLERADDILTGAAGFRAIHSLGSYKYGAHMSVSRQLLEDVPRGVIEQHIATGLDRYIRPWAYPDRMRWPAWEPFPRMTRLIERIRSRLHPFTK